MHLRSRRKLIAALTVVFLVGGVMLIFASQGFSLNIKKGVIEKRGGLFLKFAPSDATLLINGKEKRVRENFLSQGVFVSNLAPDTYRILLQKEGFVSWEKEMGVHPGMVSSESNIRLWPVNPVFVEQTSSTKTFWITKEGVITKDTKGNLAFGEKILRGTEVEFVDVSDSVIITRLESTFFLTNLSSPQESLNISDLFLSLKERQLYLPGVVPIEHIMPHPFNNEKVLITTQTSLYVLDIKKIELDRLLTTARIQSVLARSSQEAFLIDSQSNLIVVNLIFKTSSRFPLRNLAAQRMEVTPDGTHILIIHNNNTLSAYNIEDRSFQELAPSVSDFALSPEHKRVALVNGKAIEVFLLEEYYEENRKWERESSFSLPETEESAIKLLWPAGLPGHIVTLNRNGDLMIQEVTPTLPVNSALIAKNVNQVLSEGRKIFFSREGDILSIFDTDQNK